MTEWLIATGNQVATPEAWATFYNVILRSSVILLLTIVITTSMRRASSSQRHVVWSCGIGTASLIPLLHVLLPAWNAFILPAVSLSDTVATANATPALATVSQTGVSTATTLTVSIAHPWILNSLLMWSVGALVASSIIFRAHRSIRSIAEQATLVADRRIPGIIKRLRTQLELSQRIDVRHAPITIPFVYGIRTPIIVLPLESVQWTDARLQDVLVHEMAHVQRRDCLTQLMTSVMCALYWFNPLAWFAARQLREQQELACDDRVLATGRKSSAYAMHLLDFVTTPHMQPNSAMTIAAFARSQHIKHRLNAIIDTNTSRTLVTRRAYLVGGIAAVALAVPVAALTPAPDQPARDSLPASHADSSPAPERVQLKFRYSDSLSQNPSIANKPAKAQQKQPLMYLDGIAITPDELKRMNPNSVRSIEIVAGPAAIRQFGPIATDRDIMLIYTKDSMMRSRFLSSVQPGTVVADSVLLERPAQLRSGPAPVYPPELKSKGIEGMVRIMFIVDTTGRYRPGSQKVMSSTHDLFAKAVLEALPEMTFIPAMVGGRLVAQLLDLPFSFTLDKHENPGGNSK